MTHQVALTIIAQIEPGKLDELKNLLEFIGKDVEGNSIIPFTKFSTVHFARFVILEEAKDVFGKVIPASLVYSTEIDAPLEKHLDELLDLAGEGLDRIFIIVKVIPRRHSGTDRTVWLTCAIAQYRFKRSTSTPWAEQ